ncbi:hypothetical protein QOZ80_6BG0470280 [Eleusine coracana subsp. coracana]|nr:hypothetical protein QOZ80_6BG0470280 [Eleusine coracana subsp. coracana]
MAFSKGPTIAFAVAIAMALATTVCAQNTAQDFVNLHNKARAAVGVGPVGPYGENLFWGSAGRAWTAADAVRLWVKQKANYDYNTDTCAVGKKCGSYKQMVWRESTRIGCSRVVCAANLGVFIICSYDPPGNFIGERPFAFASLP